MRPLQKKKKKVKQRTAGCAVLSVDATCVSRDTRGGNAGDDALDGSGVMSCSDGSGWCARGVCRRDGEHEHVVLTRRESEKSREGNFFFEVAVCFSGLV